MKALLSLLLTASLTLSSIQFVNAQTKENASLSATQTQAAQDNADQKQTSERPLAPDWTLKTQDGRSISFSDFAGKPMLIHFWGTWCPYCKKLQPGLERLRAKYEAQGLVFIGISVNEPIGAKPQDSLTERGINFLTVVDGDDVAVEDFEIGGTPSTFFISPKGEVLGATMSSDPDDPRFVKIAEYLVNLPRPQPNA